MSALEAALGEARQNPRLQFGLVAIGAIVVLYGLLLWGDAIDSSERRLARAHEELRLAGSSDAAELRWRDAAQRAAEAAAALEARLWRAPTLAQAQAEIQDWAERALTGAGARSVTVAIGTETGSVERRDETGPTPVRLTITFDGTAQILDQVLPLLEGDQRLARITSLRAARGQSRIEIVLLAYARIAPAAQQPAAPKEPR
jgi:hypothetical protein